MRYRLTYIVEYTCDGTFEDGYGIWDEVVRFWYWVFPADHYGEARAMCNFLNDAFPSPGYYEGWSILVRNRFLFRMYEES
jgi:hypothetical protein